MSARDQALLSFFWTDVVSISLWSTMVDLRSRPS